MRIARTVSFKIHLDRLAARHAQEDPAIREKVTLAVLLCHQARTLLPTERLILALLVTLVPELILLLLLAQKETTLPQEAPLHVLSVRQESTRQTLELRIAQSVKMTSISQMLERRHVSLCCLVTIELVRQRKSTFRQESLV